MEIRDNTEIPNLTAYEYQAYLNFEPLTEPSRSFYGVYHKVFEKIANDFYEKVQHPAFLGDAIPYLFDYIIHGKMLTDMWVMAPEEYATGEQYIALCWKEKQMELEQFVKDRDRQAIADARRSIDNIILGEVFFREITSKMRLEGIL